MSHASTRAQATAAMIDRWTALARDIAQRPAATTAHGGPGELVVLGSGIAHADILIADEATIRHADYVFHCLYDRVTQTWIAELRPDALDLRILYDARFTRHDTYVCMAEALLHYVRQGFRVVAIFYGHPGIFATPTHRAVKIAKVEGHRAEMRPGISALDHLIADLGFDPMIPGLLSYEASDLLLRGRRLDPTLHTILWQVGVVGEFGYAPHGFANKGFDVLVRRLTADYHDDADVVHYIAPQYAGIQPLIRRIKVADLSEKRIRDEVGALSTFYLPPTTIASTDPVQAATLGYCFDAEATDKWEYDLSAYGPLEWAAIDRFRYFDPPALYTSRVKSPASELVMALAKQPALLASYRLDPVSTVQGWTSSALTVRARRLLAIPHPLSFNAAMEEPASSPDL